MKNYVGLVRDHSGSMKRLCTAAERDYNATVASMRDSSRTFCQQTYVSVVECGFGRSNHCRLMEQQCPIEKVPLILPGQYTADGTGTPLFDSVGALIDEFTGVAVREAGHDASFLLIATTDGLENASEKWTGSRLAMKIAQLQATDRWSFVFRVPHGQVYNLTQWGVPRENILEWDQTVEGLEQARVETVSASENYFRGRALGQLSTQSFYASTRDTAPRDIERALHDVSSDVTLWPVSAAEDGVMIQPFVERRSGAPLKRGAAFYQLTKSEKAVQDYKKIAIRDRTTSAVYAGADARQLLGLPPRGDIKLKPGALGNYDVFIQSTSVNRKLVGGTQLLYWPKVGVVFT